MNDNIARVLGLSALAERAWADRGTVNIQNISAYWKDELLLIFRVKCDMYKWH